MLLLLLQGRTPDTAVRYAGQGTITITTTFQAIATSRRYHPVAQYDMTVDQHQAEYINLNRHGT